MTECLHCSVRLTGQNWYPAHRKVGRRICKTCHKSRENNPRAIYQRAYRLRLKTNDPAKYRRLNRLSKMKHIYRWTEAEYEALYEKQRGLCAICREPEGTRAFHIDHDHDTGVVRGLLCFQCNIMLGGAKDDTKLLRAAIAYLIDPPNA